MTLKKGDYERGIENYKENSLLPGQPKVEVTPMFEMSDPVVVEWRALTVAYIEIIMERVRAVLKTNKKALSLSQLIEGGTHNVSLFYLFFLLLLFLCSLLYLFLGWQRNC